LRNFFLKALGFLLFISSMASVRDGCSLTDTFTLPLEMYGPYRPLD
jgi:hypothetical protein